MTAADSSVVVAALAAWHEGHASASAAVDRGARLPAHCLVEAYSVLTRLPPPHRIAPGAARDLLRATFPGEPLTLEGGALQELLDVSVDAGIAGGAVYDALIGMTAAAHDALLLTRDRKAARIYSALEVRFELVE